MARGMPLDRAIELFQKAIAADPFNAAAHNNLGSALMTHGNYYEGATEFQETIRLLPSNPQPRVNLGLLYETVGQYRNAQEQFEQALVVSPEYLEAIQALARVRVRIGELDGQTEGLLKMIVLRTPDSAWRDWAQKELSREWLYESPAGLTTQPTTNPNPSR
jgi:tetratricopeptide (TPR) repeat protein